MSQESHTKGADAELACCEFLCKQGLKLVEKNYRGKRGEIDLIMKDKKTLVFIEVRYRKNNDYGGAQESITPKKREKILLTAEQYLQQKNHRGDARIDVVAMSDHPEMSYTFNWIQNAF